MGGGSLMTPLLVFLFGVPPTTAIGTDIAHGAAFKTVGAVQHRRMGNVRAQLASWMLLGSAPLSLVGVWASVQIRERYGDGVEGVMAQVLGGALLFGAIGLVAKSLVHTGTSGDEDWHLTNRDRVAAVLIGAFGGFIVGLTSVGSGVFFGLTLLVLFPLRAHKVVGTDIFHAAALLYVAGAGHWLAGNVDFGLPSGSSSARSRACSSEAGLRSPSRSRRCAWSSPACSGSQGSSSSTSRAPAWSSSWRSRPARRRCWSGSAGTAGSGTSGAATRPRWSRAPEPGSDSIARHDPRAAL